MHMHRRQDQSSAQLSSAALEAADESTLFLPRTRAQFSEHQYSIFRSQPMSRPSEAGADPAQGMGVHTHAHPVIFANEIGVSR